MEMDLYFFSEELAIRMQAGAFGSLVAALAYTDARAKPLKRMFCGWVFAMFGAPLGSAVALSFLGPLGSLEKIGKHDIEMVSAFLSGLIGWRMIDFFNRKAKALGKGENK